MLKAKFKKVAVLGAGFVSKPAVDYFVKTCGYEVLLTSLNKEEADRLANGNSQVQTFELTVDNTALLEEVISQVDLVLSLVPPAQHPAVARICLNQGISMVTTSYISPEMRDLDPVCRDRGLLILNEIGEDPGLDNMNTMRLLDAVKTKKGKVKSVISYGAGLPAFEHNNNPFGYKFSWSPKGLINAAKSSAAYLNEGRKIVVPAEELFDHHCLVDLEGVGTFETYPNRDSTQYLNSFGLREDITFYRGLLRFPGWCNTMKALADLKLFESVSITVFRGRSYAEFMTSLVGCLNTKSIVSKTAEYLQVSENSDLIHKLKWLGLFNDQPISITSGTRADLLVDLMVRKLSYKPDEKDMVIVSSEVVAEVPEGMEKTISTLLVKGEPGGDSAMSRAVSLPAAIASRLILEGKIGLTGVHRPTDPTVYVPVLKEMESLGFGFKTLNSKVDSYKTSLFHV